jgi:hypothetical protein
MLIERQQFPLRQDGALKQRKYVVDQLRYVHLTVDGTFLACACLPLPCISVHRNIHVVIDSTERHWRNAGISQGISMNDKT